MIIQDVLVRDLDQRIEEIVKVDRADEHTIYTEITEYIATDHIKREYYNLFKGIAEAPSKPHEGIGVWISGFFGSGKSSFAKIVGYVLADRQVLEKRASELFKRQIADKSISELVDFINKSIPTEVIMFDVSVDRAVKKTNERMTEIMYTVLLRELGYAEDYDIAELEIELEREGKLNEFITLCSDTYGEWEIIRRGAQKLVRTSAILHRMDPGTYPVENTWSQSISGRNTDITVGQFVERAFDLCAKRRPGKALVFIIDGAGQYVAQSTDKIEDLRAIVEQFGRVGKDFLQSHKIPAPAWVMVTSPETLDEVVSALSSNRVELAKLQDRFKYHIDIAPADIREIVTRRVLAKKDASIPVLQKLFQESQSQLNAACHLENITRKSEVTEHDFVQMYPYLPHFVELSIDIMSGIRLQPGASRHLGGSNRTIIQQTYGMLVSDRTALASKPLGTLVTLDKIFDLIEGNLSSEKQKDVIDITRRFKDDAEDAGMTTRVAKTICLLEFVSDLSRTEANIAACLVDMVGSPAPLMQVQAALEKLRTAQFVRNTAEGWKLQTAQEKNWDTERRRISPRLKDRKEILQEIIQDLLDKLKTYRYRSLKKFRVGVKVDNVLIDKGQILLSVVTVEGKDTFAAKVAEVRTESRQENHKHDLYWVFALTPEIDDLITNFYASRQMVANHDQLAAQNRITRDEASSLLRERGEMTTLQRRLREKMAQEMAHGEGLFRGISKDADVLGNNLPDILRKFFDFAVPDLYPKLEMGVCKLYGTEVEAILKAVNLNVLPAVFYSGDRGLGLVVKEGDKYIPNVSADAAKEILDYIKREHAYGNKVTGKSLEEHFQGLGYGWERDLLRLVLAVLLRAGAIEVTYQGHCYRNHLDPQCRVPLTNNTAFKAASFVPRESVAPKILTTAADYFAEITESEERTAYTQQQFERDITIYTTYLENTLSRLRLSGIVPSTSQFNTTPALRDRFVSPLIEAANGETNSILNLLDTYRNVVLLGGPGSGKTTIARYLALNNIHVSSEIATASPQHICVPLYIDLRAFAETGSTHNYDLLSFGSEFVLKTAGVNVDRRMFEQLRERGFLLLLLDGLDEATNLDKRRLCLEQIEEFARNYSQNRILITSRPIGYEQIRLPEDVFMHAQILPYNEEQISQYLTIWYQQSLDIELLPQNIQQELNAFTKLICADARLHDLAVNPLLLTLLVEVYRNQGQLPATRTLLYNSIAKLLLERWFVTDALWAKMRMSKSDIYSCIAHLSIFFHRQQSTKETTEMLDNDETIHLITTNTLVRAIESFLDNRKLIEEDRERKEEAYRFVELIRGTVGIIVECGISENNESIFGFVHRVFEEYFAAVDIYERFHKVPSNLYDFITGYLTDLQWREVIFLLLEMLEATTVHELLDALLAIRDNVGALSKLDILLFIGSCLCENLIVENTLAEQIVNRLGQQTLNAATAEQREQAAVMLSLIAKTNQYGELGHKKLEKLEQRKELEQRREVLRQQISKIRAGIAQGQVHYQQYQNNLDILYHQNQQLYVELEQFHKQEVSSSELVRLLSLQDKFQQQIRNLSQVIDKLVVELQQQEIQFADAEYQLKSMELELLSLPLEQELTEPEDSNPRKLLQQREEALQQIFIVRKRLDRTRVEYHYYQTESEQLHLQIEQAKLYPQEILSKKLEEFLAFQDKLREQIYQSKHVITTLSQELQDQENQLKHVEYRLESMERELQISQTGQMPPRLQQQQEEHPITPQIELQIPVHRYYVHLERPTHSAQIGQTLTFTLHFLPIQQESSESFLLPVDALEIGIYVEAPGFYLEGNHLHSLLVVDGHPAESTLEIECKPVLSGEQTLRVLLYPGGQVRGLPPTILMQLVTVLVPLVLPSIPELIDQRTIPDPQPDVVLVITLEDLRNTQRLQVYCSCPALHMERVALEPLSLSLADITCLRQTIIQYASELCMLAPVEVQQSLRQLGAMIFDQLMPPNHALRAIYRKLRSLSLVRRTPLSWLIIADEHALLPWELVCPYEQSPSGEIDYEDFLADSFVLSHWVARQGLPLQAEAPLGWLALDHYHQYPQHLPYWHKVLSDKTFDEAEQPLVGYLALQEPKLPYYGLHILRYYDHNQETRITALDTRQDKPIPVQNDAEKMTYERRLDFTRKRPVIGLSLVEEDTSRCSIRVSQRDTQLEAGWCLPFMRAGASALVGTRWPVLPEVDQLFFRTFYDMIRSGTSLGWATGAARARVKQAFPTCADWLAYTYFGHPWCTLYQVQPAQGFTLFEALHHPEDAPFACGESYLFLASYRSEAPLWYNGHLQMQQTALQGEDVSVMVIPLNEDNIQTYPLTQVQASNDYQRLITLMMPQEETTYPVMIRFQRGKKELQTFILHLDVSSAEREKFR